MPHETIHSGHFMTSNPHTEPAIDDEDEDVEVDVVEDEEKPGLKRKESVATDEKPVTFYKFGPTKTQSFAIDASLNKLNKCIKVAYNKMTTPKWKDFKGLRLHWKQRIRLNNVIWRAYHMEFGRPLLTKKKSPYCFFAVPDDDSTHVKIEGTVLEGMYWKRRVEAVCAQYKKWRHFNRPKGHHHDHLHHPMHKKSASILPVLAAKALYLDSFGEKRTRKDTLPTRSQTPKNTSTEYFDIDDLENEFTDTLFESLNAPYMFPNPREIGISSNADFMQPGLLSLQPSLEEIMASLINDEDDSVSFLDLAPGPSNSNFNLPPFSPRPPVQQQQQKLQQLQQLPGPSSSAGSSRIVQQQPPPPIRRAPLPPAKRIAAAYEQQQQQQQLLQQQQQQAAAAAQQRQEQQQQQQLQQQQQRPIVYSSKDYLAASMLVDYSNQSPSRSAVAPPRPTSQQQQQAAAVPLQPTRQSSIGSPMMLSQPQYTSATQYGGGGGVIGAPLSVPEWKTSPSPLMAAPPGSLLGASAQLAAAQPSFTGLGGLGGNHFLVTGGDVIPTNMDYMPQFLSAAAAASAASPSPASSALMMHAAAAASYGRGLHGIPGISSSSSSIGSPAAGSAFASQATRWWVESLQQQPSTSSSTPVAASPATASASPLAAGVSAAASPAAAGAATSALLTRSHSHLGHANNHFVDPHGLMPSPGSGKAAGLRPAAAAAAASSLPRDTLSERLGTRSVLVDGSRGGQALGGLTPLSAPAETTENPWDREDPGTSRLRHMYCKEEEEQGTSQEMMKEEEEEEMEMESVDTPTVRPVRPTAIAGKRGTKQVPADSTLHPTERKRILHLHAEQSRRMALKDGFDQLMEIVPDVHSGGIKPTNAVVLAKAADHIKNLLAQRDDKSKRVADMKETIRALNERISSLQSSLPSSRKDQASSSLDQRSAIEQFFERYTKERTKEDWRFWLMARLFKPMVANYAAAIHDDPADKEEVAQSAAVWMGEQWRVAKLRPLSSEVLVYLATNTRLLTDPASLQDHIEQQVNSK